MRLPVSQGILPKAAILRRLAAVEGVGENVMAGASGNSGTPAIQRAGDFASLEAVADAGRSREALYQRSPPENILLS